MRILMLLLLAPLISFADEVQPLAIGAKAPAFRLRGVDGKTYTLKNFKADVLVIVFTANHCPTAQAYEQKLIQMAKKYPQVDFVAVSSNAPQALALEEMGYTDLGDSFEDMKKRAQELKLPFPYLYDGDEQKAARAYGPQATPHVFIFDKERRLRYQGRIDDTENPYIPAQSKDAENAIEALLAGRPVPVEQTKVFGCSIKWREKAAWVAKLNQEWAAQPVDVAPIDEAGIRELVKNPTQKLVLLNVWATWCGPCVVEFPDLVAIHRSYRNRGVELVTLSADKPQLTDKVREFLKQKQAAVRNYHAQVDAYRLIEAVDPQWSGALPYTMLIAPGGEILYRHMGLIDPLQVRKAIIDRIGRYYADDK